MENKKINIKISLVLNIIIAIMTLFAASVMFTGFKFMNGYEPVLESTKLGMLRFFTVQSNLFMGIVAVIFSVQEIKLLNTKIEEIKLKFYLLKLMSTAAVGLTFFVVFAYLGPISKGGIPSMLMNSNLFFHFIIPVVSIFNFICFEKTDKIKFKNLGFVLVPTILYEIYYLSNIFIHTENGVVSPKYDWYWFVQNGVWTAVIVAPMMLGITFVIGLILWRFNKNK